MHSLNTKLSEQLTFIERLSPVSQGAATVTTGWINMGDYERLMALIITGVLGTSATVDAKFQQASDSSGTGAKDVSGTSITQLVKASNDNDEVIINLAAEQLDVANGFCYARLSMTVGTAASLIAAAVLGAARFDPASDKNKATVVEVKN